MQKKKTKRFSEISDVRQPKREILSNQPISNLTTYVRNICYVNEEIHQNFRNFSLIIIGEISLVVKLFLNDLYKSMLCSYHLFRHTLAI